MPEDTMPDQPGFSAEDQYRITRLYEEIRGRLEELAMITARAAGVQLTDDVRRTFTPKGSATKESDTVDVEIICPGFSECVCIYHGPHGWDWERPCGSKMHGPP
jgi:hypothetical protein